MTGAGSFRDRVNVTRLKKQADGAGGTRTVFETKWSSIPAQILPMRGGEEVKGGRLASVSDFEITTRADSVTRLIVPTDRLVNTRTGVIYEVKHIADLKGENRELLFTCRSIK